MAAFEPKPERPKQLNNIRVLIDGGTRSAEIIQTAVGYPEDFWGYIKHIDTKDPAEKCIGLIYSGAEYTALAIEKNENWWIKQRRAKIICDFLMFWSRKPDNMLNEIINQETGDLIPHAYDDIKDKIKDRVERLRGLYDSLKDLKDAAAKTIEDTTNNIKSMTTELGVLITLGTTYVSDTCVAGAGTVIDTATDTINIMDHMLGDLMSIDINIDVSDAAKVGEGFINSIVGQHTNTVILMLEGLLTVCAGTMAVNHYETVFSAILNILGHIESLVKVGAAGSVLYAIGSVTHLLSEKLGKMAKDTKQELTTISENLAQISTDIRDTTGENVNETTVGDLVNRLRELVNSAAHALPAVEGAEGADVASLKRPAEAAAEENKKARPETPGGGKKHKKSQKKPRKKASKSKRSKKAAKKTRKSRKKTRGKKH